MLRTMILVLTAGATLSTAAAQDIPVGFYRFGVPDGFTESRPGAISGDGSRIIGLASSANFGESPSSFEWRYSSGLSITPSPDTMYPIGWAGLSRDGQVAAGWASDNAAQRYAATAWLAQGQPAILGRHSGYRDTIAHGVSGDGRVIFGRAETTVGTSTFGAPIRWTAETGFVSLGAAPGGSTSGRAMASNFDGSVAVGWVSNSSIGSQIAFRWSETTGYTLYPSLVRFDSISADGLWMGGTGLNNYTVRIAADGRVEQLDPSGSIGGVCRGMSANGDTIVGDGFLWEASSGMHRLDAYFASIGVIVPPDLSVNGFRNEVVGLSHDGTRILGWSVNASNQLEGWLAVIPSPGGLAFLFCASALVVRRRR